MVRAARFAGAYTFQYSKRPGTPAADLPDQIDAETVRDRYGRLVELQDELAWDANRSLVGRQVEVLIATGEGRKDAGTGRMSGRARDGRLVHLRLADAQIGRPGDLVETVITRGAPHHLLADGDPLTIRRTAAGDAWAAGRMPVTPRSSGPGAETVGLGLPRIGAPA